MNDPEVHDMIGKALAGEPPVGLEFDTVLADGRRRRTRRTAGIVGGSALGVVVAVGAAVAVSQLTTGPAGGVATPPATSSSAVTAQAPGCVVPAGQGGFSSPPDGVASGEDLAESARLTQAFARFHVPLPPGVSMDPATISLCAVKNSWGGNVTLRSPAGARALYLEVKPRANQPAGECATSGGQVRCAVKTLSDGTVVRFTASPPPEPTMPSLINVDAWRPDGTIVRLMETGSESPKPAPRILDDNALVAIATAPQLKISGPRTPASSPVRAAPPEPSNRRAGELTNVLAKSSVLPKGMRAEKVPGARVDAMAFYVSQGGYKLDANLADAAGKGNLFINLNPPVPGDQQLPISCAGDAACRLITLSDGQTAALSQQTQGGVTTITLNTARPDGSQLYLSVSNQAANKSTATRAKPPLEVADLTRIATLPGLLW